jgi:hypothetical protein
MKPLSPAHSLRAPRALSMFSVALVAACEPLSCQGRVTDSIQAVERDDVPALAPRCPDGDFSGDVDVTTQAELDTLAGCNTIRGSVIIHDSVDIVDLSALADLQRVDNGYLLALGNAALTSINLPLLSNLDNGLTAIDNPELTQVTLPALPNLEGDLTLRNNGKLAQLSFPQVERVQTSTAIVGGVPVVISVGNVILGELPALVSLDGAFPALQGIDGSLEVFATGLRSFAGLENLREILNQGGAATARTKFRVDKLNPALAVGIDFDDEFDIVPASNPDLESFAGLDDLSTIAGDVVIGFNPSLRDFSGLDDLKRIENGGAAASLYVFENDNLTGFLGLDGDGDGDGVDDGLDTITGSLFVGLYFDRFGQPVAGGNDRLVNLDGLDQLQAIGCAAPGAPLPRGLVLAFNDALEDLQGLDSLTTLPGDLVILGSQQLDSLKGALALQQIGGSLVFGQLLRRDGQPFDPDEQVEENQLKDVGFPADANGALQPQVRDPGVRFDPNGGQDGFDVLTTIGKDLVVAFSDLGDLQLTDPDTGALTAVGGRVTLYGNDAPTDLQGLQTLQGLGGLVVNFAVDAFGDLRPFPCADFTSFAGLQVDALGAGGLHLGFDDNLDDASLATLPAFTTIAGSVTLARAENRNNVGPTSLTGLRADVIGGDLAVCALVNGDAAPIAADLDNLTALDLDNVGVVNGDVLVTSCSELVDTSAGLRAVGGALELTDLPSLRQLAGMDQLQTAGAVLLHDLDELTSVSLPALVDVAGNLEVVNNPALASLALGVTSVGGALRLVELGELGDVGGLQDLASVDGDLEVIDCGALNDTNGLGSLTVVGGDLRLRRLDNLTNEARAGGAQDLSLPSLVQVGGLEITEMGDLEDLAGLQSLARIGVDEAGNLTGGGALIVAGNPRLETLFGLQGLVQVGRKLSIVGNERLAEFSFDDDDGDREPDSNKNGIAGDADDADDGFEAGFVAAFTALGAPRQEDGVAIGGSDGVVEVRNNPQLDQDDFLDVVIDNLDNRDDTLLIFCGNEGSVDDDDDRDETVFSAVCPAGQDGVSGLF